MLVIERLSGKYRFAGNFYVEEDGLTNEHRFQARKATNKKDREYVLAAPSPAIAKQRGNEIDLIPGWDDLRIGIMFGLLMEKFSDPFLKGLLLETGDAIIVEGNTWGDDFWGTVNGKGANWLGRLLMLVRSIKWAERVHTADQPT